jgi:hypothetical protein
VSSRIEIQLVGDWGEQLRRNLDEFQARQKQALAETAREVASELRREIFHDIQAGGDFGNPWKHAVKVSTRSGGDEATITVRYSSSPLGQAAELFEEGGTVQGHPLLWIPLNDRQSLRQAIIRAGGAVYVQSRAGKHLLIGRDTHRPIAIGVEQITQHKRFHIHAVVERVAKDIPEIWRKKLAKLNK